MDLRLGNKIITVLLLVGVRLGCKRVLGCTDGLQACFMYFNPRQAAIGTGAAICDLVSDQLDCLSMVKLRCSPVDTVQVEGAIQGVSAEYQAVPHSCTFNNIGQTTDYAMYQCKKLFDDCRARITDATCGLIDEYTTCKEGLSTFCTPGNLQDVVDFVNVEKTRLNTEQGCAFVVATTQRPKLTGTDCFTKFTTCYESQGVTQTSPACIAAPVFLSCFQSDVIDACDSQAVQQVSSYTSSKQSECDAVTTTSTTTTTTTSTGTQTSARPETATIRATSTTPLTVPSTSDNGPSNSTKQPLVGVIEIGPGQLILNFKSSATSMGYQPLLVTLCLVLTLCVTAGGALASTYIHI